MNLTSENIKAYITGSEKQFEIFNIPYTEKEKKYMDRFDLSDWERTIIMVIMIFQI